MKCRVLPVAVLAVLAWVALRPPAAAAVPAGVPLAWGFNGYGQLGNGTFADSGVPMPVSNLSGVVAVSGGFDHSLALKADGTVWAWGLNDIGQLGIGVFGGTRSTPVQVFNLSGVVAIDCGGSQNLALGADGTVWTWGLNDSGQLGDGTTTNRNKPVQVANIIGVVAIAGGAGNGGRFSLALKADGTVWAWGYNDSGQLGDGTFTNRSRPVRVANLPGVIAIAACGHHGLALAPDGVVWAWGHNLYGQLGNGTFTPGPQYGISSPAPVSNLAGVVSIADGGGQSFALKADGTVWSWGRNNGGQLGQGTITSDSNLSNTIPAQVVNADGTVFDGVVAIDPSMAVRSDGTVWAWGGNSNGELGNGTIGSPPSPNPLQVSGVVAPIDLGAGTSHRLAVELAAEYSVELQQPVNVDGTSVFKKSSTVEVRFRLTGASTGITDAQARFGYAQIDSANPGNVNESVSNAAGTSGILFQYDAGSGEYRYNWRTTGLGTGRYLLRIDLGDGVMRTVAVGLK